MSEKRAVVVLGGTGYVGQLLCKALVHRGWQVVAVCSESRAFLLSRLGVETVDEGRLGNRTFEFVVNLAYPTQGLDFTHKRQNRDIARLVVKVCKPGAVVVHASSLAVFGMELDIPISPVLLRMRRDLQYIECKIEMEGLLVDRLARASCLNIVRLGNVWGPGSPLWAVGLLQRLIDGLPVAVAGCDGYSNCTDVSNVVDYVDYLLRRGGANGYQIHHLAELSEHRWSEFTRCLADGLGVGMVVASGRIDSPRSVLGEIRRAIGAIPRVPAVRYAMTSRYLASYLRSLIELVPANTLASIENAVRRRSLNEQLEAMVGDVGVLKIVGCMVQFNTQVESGWRPPIGLEQSLRNTKQWMVAAGYSYED